MALAVGRGNGYVGREVVRNVAENRAVLFRRRERNSYSKVSLVVSGCRVAENCVSGISRHYPRAHVAIHLVCNPCSGHAYTRVSTGCTFSAYGVANFIGHIRIRNLHLKRRTFIFLHTESGIGKTFGRYAEPSGQTRLRKLEVCSKRTELVACNFLCCYFFGVGIEQFERNLLVVERVERIALAVVHNAAHVYFLPGAVYSAVGVEAGFSASVNVVLAVVNDVQVADSLGILVIFGVRKKLSAVASGVS